MRPREADGTWRAQRRPMRAWTHLVAGEPACNSSRRRPAGSRKQRAPLIPVPSAFNGSRRPGARPMRATVRAALSPASLRNRRLAAITAVEGALRFGSGSGDPRRRTARREGRRGARRSGRSAFAAARRAPAGQARSARGEQTRPPRRPSQRARCRVPNCPCQLRWKRREETRKPVGSARPIIRSPADRARWPGRRGRSEEHTSELQSR